MPDSRGKGKRGEREAAEVMRAIYPHADNCQSQARGAAKDGPDVDGEGVPWHVEVKIGKAPPIAAGMRQAMRDTKGRPPLVLSRKDREKWLVTMRWEDFERLAKLELMMQRIATGIRAREAEKAGARLEVPCRAA